MCHIECSHHFILGKQIMIWSNRPAEQTEVVQQTFRDHAAFTVQEKIRFWITLGELLVTFTHNVWEVTKHWHVLRDSDFHECTVKHNLTWSGRKQIFATQHVRDFHQGIIHRVRQGVQRLPVSAHDHIIWHRSCFERDFATHHISERDVLIWHPHTQHRLAAFSTEGFLLFFG